MNDAAKIGQAFASAVIPDSMVGECVAGFDLPAIS